MKGFTRNIPILFFMVSAAFLYSQTGPGGGTGGGAGARMAPGTETASGGRSPFVIAEISEKYYTISAGGRLKPKISVDHLAAAAGTVLAVNVREGQAVAAGQELFSVERDAAAGSFMPAVTTARISGIISRVFIAPKDEISTGHKGVTVVGTGGYILEAAISDKDAFRINVGEPVVGHTSDGGDLKGTLSMRSIEPDYATGLFSLTFEFPQDTRARIGEFVMVDLPVDRTSGIFVKRELLVRRYGRFYMWSVSEENTLVLKEVKTGAVIGGDILITEGITPGDRYLGRLTGREKEGAPAGPPAE